MGDGKAVAWSILDKRTGKHWYTNESKNTAQCYANQYSHRESDGSPSMIVQGLVLASDYDALARKCEGLEKDAARYRWLRKFNIDSYLAIGKEENLDAQIDEHLSQGGVESGNGR